MRPIIALLTDFGLADHYVAAMKGVILSRAPEVTLVDITHDIAPQDVLSGALALAAASPYFPAGTIFLAVVDPGVGSGRRAVAVEAAGQMFVGPDNGLLWPAASRTEGAIWRQLTSADYWLPTVSRTFEGRDRFAPVAASLATGIPMDALGPVITPVALTWPAAQVSAAAVDGAVLTIDRFGNLITNITRAQVSAVPPPAVVDIAGHRALEIVSTFADVAQGAPCALVGSSDTLEVVVNGGNARRVLGVEQGTPVRVRSGA